MNDTINISEYSSQIGLELPYSKQHESLETSEQEQLVDELLEELRTEVSHIVSNPKGGNSGEKRRLLHAVLNTLSPNRLNLEDQAKLNQLLQSELLAKEIKRAEDIEVVAQINNTKIGLWKGDIACLEIDAIVNAANDRLLGCFQPLHACIDNVIHSAAGVQLRDDCHKIMNIQGAKERTGVAKITRAYNLPSQFVIHTVGPIVHGELDTIHEELLADCYTHCLAIISELPVIKSIAFCCISTGVFGYPQQEAAALAVKTVFDWLQNNEHHLETLVFNVFLEKDLKLYQKYLT